MIVMDSSTLILIAKAELLDPFIVNVGVSVAIPGQVERECCGSKGTLDEMMIQKAVRESRIQVIPVKSGRAVEKLQMDFSLGQGEAEAIALAVNERAQLVGIDDKNGINACKLLGLGFTTAVGILVRFREKRLIGSPEALEKLTALVKYGRYKDSIIQDARRRLEAGS